MYEKKECLQGLFQSGFIYRSDKKPAANIYELSVMVMVLHNWSQAASVSKYADIHEVKKHVVTQFELRPLLLF